MNDLLTAAKAALAALSLHDGAFYAPEIKLLREAIAREEELSRSWVEAREQHAPIEAPDVAEPVKDALNIWLNAIATESVNGGSE